jgi:uncharacterized Zn-finger protein
MNAYDLPSDDKNDDENADTMKAFYCSYSGCKKSFRYRSEILRHMVTHTSKRPYVCTFKNCMKGFKRSDALATHMRIHTREKTFECPYGSCKSTFSTKAGLKYHTLKHKTEKNSTNHVCKQKPLIEQENFSSEIEFSEDLYLDMSAECMFETPLNGLNFQEQYPMGENYYGNPASDMAYFDNTQVQPINPIFGDKAVFQENNEFDAYMTTYSTPSNVSNNSKDADVYNNYHFINAPQNAMSCAATLINNTEDFGFTRIKSNEVNDKLIDMMQKIVEENSNLKKRLETFQRVIRNPQYLAEEQNGIF